MSAAGPKGSAAVRERQRRARIDHAGVLAAGAGHEDGARPVPGAHEDVRRARRTVHEVPRVEVALLLLDEQQALAGEDEEVLLFRLAVIEGAGLAGLHHAEGVADLREAVAVAFERAVDAEALTALPDRVLEVDREPPVGGRRQTGVRLLQACFVGHRAPS